MEGGTGGGLINFSPLKRGGYLRGGLNRGFTVPLWMLGGAIGESDTYGL